MASLPDTPVDEVLRCNLLESTVAVLTVLLRRGRYSLFNALLIVDTVAPAIILSLYVLPQSSLTGCIEVVLQQILKIIPAEIP